MNNVTLPTINDLYGENRLSILGKVGLKAQLSDLAILLAGNSSIDEDKYGDWWTMTHDKSSIYGINVMGRKGIYAPLAKMLGLRPMLNYSQIAKDCSTKRLNNKGIFEVEYGEYPQELADENTSNLLSKMKSMNSLQKTGKKYTLPIIGSNETELNFICKDYEEYEYKGSKYIRIVPELNADYMNIDDRTIKNRKECWIKVKPITWYLDELNDRILSKDLLVTGLPFSFNNQHLYGSGKTVIGEFLNKCFINDIRKRLVNESNYDSSPYQYDYDLKLTSSYNLNYDYVDEEEIIRGAIEANIPVFLHGPSSEGKSSRVKQIDPDCTIVYLRNASPDFLNGKSVYVPEKNECINIKPSWLKKLEQKCEKEPDKIHILFFDEISNALPSIQGMAFNIVLDREVNGEWKLPENVRIVAAGNEKKDSLSANDIAEPLFNRFAHVYIETTLDKWLSWALKNNIHPAIYAFMIYTNGKALRSNYNGETPNADPRKWEMASKMLYATGKAEMLRSLIGKEITSSFVAFCKKKVCTLQDVLENKIGKDINKINLAEKYALIVELTKVDEENYYKIKEFVLQFGSELTTIFDNLWSRNNDERKSIVENYNREKLIRK